MRHFVTALCLAIACSPGFGADAPKNGPPESRQAECEKDAGAVGLKGKERQDFMSKCLSGKPAGKDGKPPTANVPTRQEKVAACGKEAGARALTGEEREKFMSSCVKK